MALRRERLRRALGALGALRAEAGATAGDAAKHGQFGGGVGSASAASGAARGLAKAKAKASSSGGDDGGAPKSKKQKAPTGYIRAAEGHLIFQSS